MSELLGLALVFLVVTGLCFAGLEALQRRRRRLETRLEAQDVDSAPELILGDLTPTLAQTPMSLAARNELERDLRDAGYYRPTALMEYRAVRTVLMILPLLGFGALSLVVEQAQMPLTAGLGLAGAVLGFSLPRVYLRARARSRARDIERGLPVAVDLLTLGLSAGQNILAAFHRVSRELSHSYPVLSQELEIVARQADLGSLPHALEQLAERVRVPEVRTLALILVQSERLGTDIAAALLEFSSNFRTTMKQRAEAQANRASFWMVFPTLFCMWLPAAALLMLPVYYEFWHRRQATAEIIQKRSVEAGEVTTNRSVTKQPAGEGPGAPAPTPTNP
jgi:tight adherence protein C